MALDGPVGPKRMHFRRICNRGDSVCFSRSASCVTVGKFDPPAGPTPVEPPQDFPGGLTVWAAENNFLPTRASTNDLFENLVTLRNLDLFSISHAKTTLNLPSEVYF